MSTKIIILHALISLAIVSCGPSTRVSENRDDIFVVKRAFTQGLVQLFFGAIGGGFNALNNKYFWIKSTGKLSEESLAKIEHIVRWNLEDFWSARDKAEVDAFIENMGDLEQAYKTGQKMDRAFIVVRQYRDQATRLANTIWSYKNDGFLLGFVAHYSLLSALHLLLQEEQIQIEKRMQNKPQELPLMKAVKESFAKKHFERTKKFEILYNQYADKMYRVRKYKRNPPCVSKVCCSSYTDFIIDVRVPSGSSKDDGWSQVWKKVGERNGCGKNTINKIKEEAEAQKKVLVDKFRKEKRQDFLTEAFDEVLVRLKAIANIED